MTYIFEVLATYSDQDIVEVIRTFKGLYVGRGSGPHSGHVGVQGVAESYAVAVATLGAMPSHEKILYAHIKPGVKLES